MNLIRLLAVKTNIDSNMCSDSSSCLAVYDYFSDTLKDELLERFSELIIIKKIKILISLQRKSHVVIDTINC